MKGFWAHWRITIAYLLIVAVGIYGFYGQRSSTNDLRAETRRSEYASCVARAEGRQTLRDLVVEVFAPQPGDPPRSPGQAAAITAFQTRTLQHLPIIPCSRTNPNPKE